MKIWLIAGALLWAWICRRHGWLMAKMQRPDLARAAEIGQRLLAAGLTVPGGGTPGSSGKDGNPSLFGIASWAAPEELLAAKSALRSGRLVVLRQFLDPDAAKTLRNEIGRLFAARGNWTESTTGNWSLLDDVALEQSLRNHLLPSPAGLNCTRMSQLLQAAGVPVGSRPWRRHQEHALPGSLGSTAIAQTAGATTPVLGAFTRIMHSEEMAELVAWLFDQSDNSPPTDSGHGPVTFELKVTRWRPRTHWAAPHEDSLRPRSGLARSQRFAALTFHLCDSSQEDAGGEGGAFLWCAPPARVPCAFNQLVLFALKDGASHAVEPVLPSQLGGQASSRWTLQAWASARSADTEKEKDSFLRTHVQNLLSYFGEQKAWWDARVRNVASEVPGPHFSGR